MRNSNPKAVTFKFSCYPEMKEAASAILMQADELLVKPMDVKRLVKTIKDRLKQGAAPGRVVDNVATILEQETQPTIRDWLARVDAERHISPTTFEMT